MAHQQQVNVMADIFHPMRLPKKVAGNWVKVFCEQHLEALKNINLAVNFAAPFIDEATNEQLANYTKCRRCNKYCPVEMYANLKNVEGKKAICCICSKDEGIIPADVVTGIKEMAQQIFQRKNIYTNRLTKYTCELCNISMTNSAKSSHETSKQHTDNLKLKKERDERNITHEEIIDQYEDQITKLESEIVILEEQVTDFEDKITEFEDKVVELEENNIDLKKQVKDFEQKVVERDIKIIEFEDLKNQVKERDDKIIELEELVTDFEDKVTELEDKVIESLEVKVKEFVNNNADLKKQVKEFEQKVVERDDKIYMLETELDRAQNEADNFRSKYEELLAKMNKPKVTRPYYRRNK